ncbi:hypothetical protein ACFUTX_14195 [Microbacterium sp. NPDC057407]|uniref:hypothetical protein n=1 Tax=Microbacterium sp. NPDC057407 TaxID=3346120 RepID=UPI0036717FFA
MKKPAVVAILGALVLAAGVLLLLETTGVVVSQPALWAIVLAGGAAAFGYVFFTERRSWWAAIPSAALLGAAVSRLMELDPQGAGQWTEVPMLAALGVGFGAIYIRDHGRWWALIPGGILLTLAVVTGAATAVDGAVSGAIFLFGAALTFLLVAVLPGGAGRRWWAYIPAAVLAVGGLAVLFTSADWIIALNVLWPSAVVAAGAFLIWRAVRMRRDDLRTKGAADASARATS